MSNLYQERHMITTSKGNCITLRLSYRDHTYAMLTGERIGKGYVVNVVPSYYSTSDNGISIDSTEMLTGFNCLLVPCERRSKKKEAEAINILMRRRQEFINAIIDMHQVKECATCG